MQELFEGPRNQPKFPGSPHCWQLVIILQEMICFSVQKCFVQCEGGRELVSSSRLACHNIFILFLLIF